MGVLQWVSLKRHFTCVVFKTLTSDQPTDRLTAVAA